MYSSIIDSSLEDFHQIWSSLYRELVLTFGWNGWSSCSQSLKVGNLKLKCNHITQMGHEHNEKAINKGSYGNKKARGQDSKTLNRE